MGGDAAAGKKLRKRFAEAVPAWGSLKSAVENALVYPIDYKHGQRKQKWKRHYLLGLDNRHLHVRSVHSALNLLLQSAGALICKKWIVTTEERLIARGLKHGWNGDFALMAWVHKQNIVHYKQGENGEILMGQYRAKLGGV